MTPSNDRTKRCWTQTSHHCRRRASCTQLHLRTHLANTPAKRRSATLQTEACFDGGTLPQTIPAVQVPHQVKQELSLTAGLSHSALNVVKGTVVASIARPKLTDSKGMPSQLARSARASNGLAEACTPLFPMLSSAARTNPFQPLNTAKRRDVGQAVFGSVPPKTFPRKSSHLSSTRSSRPGDCKWPCQAW